MIYCKLLRPYNCAFAVDIQAHLTVTAHEAIEILATDDVAKVEVFRLGIIEVHGGEGVDIHLMVNVGIADIASRHSGDGIVGQLIHENVLYNASVEVHTYSALGGHHNIIKHRVGKWDNADIVGGFPLISERERICRTLGAREIFIDTPKEICIERLKACDDRDQDEYMKYIEDWWRKYGAGMPPEAHG